MFYDQIRVSILDWTRQRRADHLNVRFEPTDNKIGRLLNKLSFLTRQDNPRGYRGLRLKTQFDHYRHEDDARPANVVPMPEPTPNPELFAA